MSKKLTILTIDGGGVRGVIAAGFLEEFEAKTGLRAADCFGYFAGSSAGGLVALHLAIKGQDANAAADLFNPKNSGAIMDQSLLDKILPAALQWGPKYDGTGKQKVLREVFGDARLADARKPVLVTSYDLVQRQLLVFKSHGGEGARGNPLVWQIADATSAAPTFFPPTQVDTLPDRVLVDGGIAANNPAMSALAEALKMGYDAEDITLISLGTGVPDIDTKTAVDEARHAADWGGVGWLQHGIINHLMDGAASSVDYFCKQILGDRYIRVQGPLVGVSPAMDDVRPENLKALREIGHRWYATHAPRLAEVIATLQPEESMEMAA